MATVSCCRRAVSRNESVKYVVQDSVIEYLTEHKLYGDYNPGQTHST